LKKVVIIGGGACSLGACNGGNGLGFGNGSGMESGTGNGTLVESGDGSGDFDDGDSAESVTKDTTMEEIDAEQEKVVTVTPMPMVYDVIIERDKIIFNNETVSSAQSLSSMIKNLITSGEEVRVVINDEFAYVNTLEDVKNALEKNDIPWEIAE